MLNAQQPCAISDYCIGQQIKLSIITVRVQKMRSLGQNRLQVAQIESGKGYGLRREWGAPWRRRSHFPSVQWKHH